ncbi:patatin-like phospholipase family protein [Pararhizobium arenae]|uniref:patatin-like phospholipase family protein n=1 Tax=Pararhizobium arenae TaxID=1856850 RepID=UPI00094AD4CA|nr:patatin-like phospholipase family protein [Pararhizobium arenae]
MEDAGEIWLCLSGGNALGAYHAGVYSVLHKENVQPARIAGTSIGAIVGAIIAGSKLADRLVQLDRFWEIATDFSLLQTWYLIGMDRKRSRHLTHCCMGGQRCLDHQWLLGGDDYMEPRPHHYSSDPA